MKRKSPIRRSPMRKRANPNEYNRRPRDTEFMLWVKQQPCALSHLGSCEGPVEADHAGDRPFGRKAPDRTCIPLCRRHHSYRHDCRGFFALRPSMTADDRRAWVNGVIVHTQRKYLALGHRFVEDDS